jgi:hypothetical protein
MVTTDRPATKLNSPHTFYFVRWYRMYLCNQFSTKTATVIVIYVDTRYESFVMSCTERLLTAEACTIRNSLDIPKLFRQNCENQLLTSSCLSVRPTAWYNSAPIGQIFMKFYTMKYLLVSRANNGYAHAPQCYITYTPCLVTNPIYVCPSKRLPAALPIVEACLFCIDGMAWRCKVHTALIKIQDNIIVCTTVNSHCAIRYCSPSTAISALNEAFLYPHESLLIPTKTQCIVWRQGRLARNLFTPSCRPYWRPAIKHGQNM